MVSREELGSWVLGLGSWVLGLGSWVLGLGSWVLGENSVGPLLALPKTQHLRPKTHFALSHGSTGQLISLGVVCSRNVRDGEIQGARQLAAGPMQGVEAGTATEVLASHLADDDLGIRVNVQGLGLQGDGALQGFHERDVFGDVVILVADPLGDADGATGAAVDHHPNTRWPWIAQGTTVYVGHKF
jgi:hypothetical protein